MAARWFDRFAVDWSLLKSHPGNAPWRDGRFTIVEHPQQGKKGLTVRPVDDTERIMVFKRGGFLFATEAQAWAFVECSLDPDGPGRVRVLQTFSHKRIDGLRIYTRLGNPGAG